LSDRLVLLDLPTGDVDWFCGRQKKAAVPG